MSDLTQLAERLPPGSLNTLVHIGAGDGQQIEDYRRLASRRLVLVEGDPEIARQLAVSTSGLPSAEVHVLAVAPQDGALEWHRYNLAWLNGPVEAEPLRRKFPRLRRCGGIRLIARGLASFLESVLPLGGGPEGNLLLLDVPGQESSLLRALTQQSLESFEWICVRRISDAGASDASPSVLDALLAPHHLRREGDWQGDALWTCTLYRLDQQTASQARLAARIQALEVELKDAREEAAGYRAQLDELGQHLVSKSLLIRRQEVELEESRSQLQATQRFAAEQSELTRELSRQLETANQSRLSAERSVQEARLEVDAVNRHLNEIAKELKEAKQQLGEAQEGMALAVRLQTIRDNDLRELQQRYAAVYQTQRSQHELLTQLAERLAVASDYFQSLSRDENPDQTTTDRFGRAELRRPIQVLGAMSGTETESAPARTEEPEASAVMGVQSQRKRKAREIKNESE